MLACLSEDNCIRKRLYGLNFLAELWWPKVYFMGMNVWRSYIQLYTESQTDMYMFSVQSQSEKTGSFDILFFCHRLHTNNLDVKPNKPVLNWLTQHCLNLICQWDQNYWIHLYYWIQLLHYWMQLLLDTVIICQWIQLNQ